VGPKHDVVGEQLGASVEQLGQRLRPVLGVEPIVLVNRDPREPAALLGDLLAELGVLGLEPPKLVACRLPFLAGSNRVLGHRSTSFGVGHLSVGGGRGSSTAASRGPLPRDRRATPNSSTAKTACTRPITSARAPDRRAIRGLPEASAGRSRRQWPRSTGAW